MFGACESKWKRREKRIELFMWRHLRGVVSKLIWTISMLRSALAVNIGALPHTRKSSTGLEPTSIPGYLLCMFLCHRRLQTCSVFSQVDVAPPIASINNESQCYR